MKIGDSRTKGGPGILPLQAHDPRWKIEERPSVLAYRIRTRLDAIDQFGHWVQEDGTLGDILCAVHWPKASRVISGWSWAWPSIVGKGGGATSASGPDNGANIGIDLGLLNASLGFATQGAGGLSGAVGIDIGLLNQTLADDPTAPPTEPGSGADESTPSGDVGGGGACATAPASALTLLPVHGKDWSADGRFAAIQANRPKANGKDAWPKPCRGTYGITAGATNEGEQVELFYQIDPRLIAVNIAGDKDMGSMVCDLTEKFEVDMDRVARLQSAFRVIKKPFGGANAIGFQLGPSGCQDVEGGYFVDRAPGTGDGKNKCIGRGSWFDGGPFDCGSQKDKHKKGVDADGNTINALHIQSGFNLRKNDAEDGPLRIEQYIAPFSGNVPMKVHFGWAGSDWAWWAEGFFMPVKTRIPPWLPPPKTPDPRLDLSLFDFRIDVPSVDLKKVKEKELDKKKKNERILQDVATVDKNAKKTTAPKIEKTRLGGATKEIVGTPKQISVPCYVMKPLNYGSQFNDLTQLSALGGSTGGPLDAVLSGPDAGGGAGGTSTSTISTTGDFGDLATGALAQINKYFGDTPVTMQVQSFGAQGGQTGTTGKAATPVFTGGQGDPWVYTQTPIGNPNYPGGTANGGVLILPPEVSIADDAEAYAPAGITKSSTYWAVGPGAFFGAGSAMLANGHIKTGHRWGVDASGNTLFEQMSSFAVASRNFRLTTDRLAQFALGTSTGWGNVAGRLEAITTTASSTGSASEETLQTVTILANTLDANGKGLRIKAQGTTANSVNAKTIRLYFSTTLVIFNDITPAPDELMWTIDCLILRSGGSGVIASASMTVGAVTQTTKVVFPSANLAADQTVTLRVLATVDSGDVETDGMLVEAIS